jgi:hypothetical protein
MARACSICSHIDRDEIDVALTGGSTLVAIGAKFHVTRDSLARHKSHHVTPALVRLARQRRDDASAVTISDQLGEVVARANRLLDRAEERGALVGGAQLLGQLRQTLELIAKLSGELDERPQLTVNLQTSPEWVEIRSLLMAALTPYPDARLAVAAALSGRQAGEPAALPMTTVDTFAVATDVPTKGAQT